MAPTLNPSSANIAISYVPSFSKLFHYVCGG